MKFADKNGLNNYNVAYLKVHRCLWESTCLDGFLTWFHP